VSETNDLTEKDVNLQQTLLRLADSARLVKLAKEQELLHIKAEKARAKAEEVFKLMAIGDFKELRKVAMAGKYGCNIVTISSHGIDNFDRDDFTIIQAHWKNLCETVGLTARSDYGACSHKYGAYELELGVRWG
jgi:hypothetical protein